MLKSETQKLPSSAELPCSDDTPVDNEEQNFIPNFLLFLLEYIWGERQDWFFGVDMAIYHTTGNNVRVPIIPDGFLALNVERCKGGEPRSSYVMWEENNVAPILALEIVSKTPGGEYSSKEALYAQLGVLYYVIYNPRQFGGESHQKLEVYKLINGRYHWQVQEPVWMPEIDLGIGRGVRNYGEYEREILYWFDEEGNRYASTEEELEIVRQRVESAEQQTEQERQRAESAEQRAESAEQQIEQLQRELERYRQQLGDLPDL
ncbi:Uma2 family endonuclease [Oscillatoria sp. FACHB-1406]|uniref:Uma2 family endonuclease n=1 Tax=Oscillatoria sp. FACHB-1406 TaxID=2692846 RepID=UPI001684A726|nr:Uma2 family endonuclease [Oscillatoria sp. FACHB-1406]MBD2579183.1 Uma2 family endonuclease [Oscillatoria sp. FACHB-1406]